LGPRAGVLGGSALLSSAEAGDFDVLFVVDHALAPEKLKALAAKVKVLVGLHSHEHEGSEAYAVQVPLAVAAEQDGSFTNVHGRLQRNRKALEPVGDSLPGYALAQRFGAALGLTRTEDAPAALFTAWAESQPRSFVSDLTLESLGALGAASAASAIPA
jgi:NADH dehydrogenase/NADH:ubiquinone oxidoreductase subunit G